MGKTMLTLLSVLCIISCLVSPQVVYADDMSTSEAWTWLTSSEKQWVNTVRSDISATKNLLAAMKKKLTDTLAFIVLNKESPGAYVTWLESNAKEVNIYCTGIHKLMPSTSRVPEFQKISNAFSDIKIKGDALIDLAKTMKNSYEVFTKPIRLPWAMASPELIFSSVRLNSLVDNVGNELNKIEGAIASRIKEIAAARKKEGPTCFIATAAYGTPTAKEIDELRRFRDEYLRKSTFGNDFIEFYYENSPPIARFISEHELIRVIVREAFVEPVVKIVELTEVYWAE